MEGSAHCPLPQRCPRHQRPAGGRGAACVWYSLGRPVRVARGHAASALGRGRRTAFDMRRLLLARAAGGAAPGPACRRLSLPAWHAAFVRDRRAGPRSWAPPIPHARPPGVRSPWSTLSPPWPWPPWPWPQAPRARPMRTLWRLRPRQPPRPRLSSHPRPPLSLSHRTLSCPTLNHPPPLRARCARPLLRYGRRPAPRRSGGPPPRRRRTCFAARWTLISSSSGANCRRRAGGGGGQGGGGGGGAPLTARAGALRRAPERPLPSPPPPLPSPPAPHSP